jgi:hypothetical protein
MYPRLGKTSDKKRAHSMHGFDDPTVPLGLILRTNKSTRFNLLLVRFGKFSAADTSAWIVGACLRLFGLFSPYPRIEAPKKTAA